MLSPLVTQEGKDCQIDAWNKETDKYRLDKRDRRKIRENYVISCDSKVNDGQISARRDGCH